MFGKNKTERSFSIMLAEEVLRAELKKFYGGEIKFFQCDIDVTSASVERDSLTISDFERQACPELVNGRLVEITAIIGPFGFLYPVTSDRRRELRRVEAECRVFSVLGSVVVWRPHFLRVLVKDEYARVVEIFHRHYEGGLILNSRFEKDADNPCQDMCNSQIPVNYPKTGLNVELHTGIDPFGSRKTR